jgi:hypothetical protein
VDVVNCNDLSIPRGPLPTIYWSSITSFLAFSVAIEKNYQFLKLPSKIIHFDCIVQTQFTSSFTYFTLHTKAIRHAFVYQEIVICYKSKMPNRWISDQNYENKLFLKKKYCFKRHICGIYTDILLHFFFLQNKLQKWLLDWAMPMSSPKARDICLLVFLLFKVNRIRKILIEIVKIRRVRHG